LVNNAAGKFHSQTKDLSPRVRRHRNIVLHGTFYMTNALRQALDSRAAQGERDQHPHDLGVDRQSFVVASAMSKAGVAVMTRASPSEWGRHGIRLNAIAPGPSNRGRLGLGSIR